MADLRNTLATTLVLYLFLLPFAGIPAAAQGSDPTSRPIDPNDGHHSSSFEAGSPPLTFRAFNGFRSETATGRFHHMEHLHAGGIGKIESPWGEELNLRFWMIPGGFAIEYDGELTVSYRFDEAGVLQELVAETAERQARTEIGRRAELVYLGQRELSSLDMSAYLVVEEALRERHSEAFLAGLREFDGPAEASCATSSILCGTCVLGWTVTVGTLVTACVAAGVPTFGLSCLLALMTHETASIGCAATCIVAWEDCGGGVPDEDPIPEGCNEPGP